MFLFLTCGNTSRHGGNLSNHHLNIHVQKRFRSEGAGGTVRCPAGAKRGPLFTRRPCISAHGGKLGAFHLIQTGMFSEPIKSPNICSRLCHQPSAPLRLLDKTFRRLLLAFVLHSFDWKVPLHHHHHLRRPSDPSDCLFTAVTKGGN